MKYSEPRFTKDIDLWVGTDPRNAQKVYDALRAFGAPLAGITPGDFTKPGYFYQMGRPPFRVDVVMTIDGVDFEAAWNNRLKSEIGGVTVNYISKQDLIRAKEACGRLQDVLDLESLRKAL